MREDDEAAPSSAGLSGVGGEDLAWRVGKSPLPFQLRRFRHRSGGESIVLIDKGEGPAFYPNLFVTCAYLKVGKAATTSEQVLRAIGMARAWARARGRDLDHDLRSEEFLSLGDAEMLADHLLLAAIEQAAELEVALRKPIKLGTVLKLEALRPSPRDLVADGLEAAMAHALARILYVAEYAEWHLSLRLGALDRGRKEAISLQKHGEHVVARLRERARGPKAPSNDDEALEGVPSAILDRITEALRPGFEDNPFRGGFTQARNHLLWLFYRSCSGRRGEIQSIRVKDVDYANRRVFIHLSKTKPRMAPISPEAAEAFDSYITEYWAKLPQAVRRRGYLFTGPSSAPLTVRSVNRIFEIIRDAVPDCPDFLTPHTLRRSWNDQFVKLIDSLPPDKRPPPEREKAIINRVNGWSEGSAMGGKYGKRHIRRLADELADRLARDIGRGADDGVDG